MAGKKVAILQSNYIPWKGYFDLIASVDEFILYDDMQFTKNDWRNRNLIKTPQGTQWLSIPTGKSINRRIRDVELTDHTWQIKHWKSILCNYKRSPYFSQVSLWLKDIYLEETHISLSEANRRFIDSICCYLEIGTIIRNSREYELADGKTERLVDLCIQACADEYITGPSARNYINSNLFHEKGISLTWFDYSNYPEYSQQWNGFTHEVTILDLLFNCGKSAVNYMKIGNGCST